MGIKEESGEEQQQETKNREAIGNWLVCFLLAQARRRVSCYIGTVTGQPAGHNSAYAGDSVGLAQTQLYLRPTYGPYR